MSRSRRRRRRTAIVLVASCATSCGLVACQLILGLDPPHGSSALEDGAPIDAPLGGDGSDDGGPHDAHGALCDPHPDAWICDDFGVPSEGGAPGWMSCIVGPSSYLEVTTADFQSAPSSFHAVIGSDGAADAADPNRCSLSATIHRDRSRDATHRIQFDARIIVRGNQAQDVPAAFVGVAYIADAGVVSSPAVTYSAATTQLALTDLSSPDAAPIVLGGPGTEWFHVILSIIASATPTARLEVVIGGKHDVSKDLPITALPTISVQFGLRAESAADYEIYVDNLIVE